MDIKSFLLNNKILPNIAGFNYLISAVDETKNYHLNNKGKCQITKYLYPKIAKDNNVTASSVGRGIRYCISKIKDEKFLEIGLNKNPTNSEVIVFFAIM